MAIGFRQSCLEYLISDLNNIYLLPGDLIDATH
jgi:hypothetical protein